MTEQYQLWLIQIIIVLILVIIILLLLKQRRAITFERRIGKYAIDPITDDEESFFDKLEQRYLHYVKKLRPIFKKVKSFEKYADRYNIYIKYTNQDTTMSIDFIINKFLIGFGVLFLYVFSEVAQNRIPRFSPTILVFAAGFFALDIYLKYHQKLKKTQVENGILKAVIIMNNAFKSGKSTLQAVEIAMNQLPKPINEEFRKIYVDLKFGMSVDVAFDRFASRVDVEEVKYITSSLTILNKTGGNIINVFNSIEKSLFDRKKLNEELKNLTSSSKLVIKSLLFIPFLVIGVVLILNPQYFNPLFELVEVNGIKYPLGYILIAIMALLFSMYIYLLNRIIRISV